MTLKNARLIAEFKNDPQKVKLHLALATKHKKVLDEIRRFRTRNEHVPILRNLVDKAYADSLHNTSNAWQQWNSGFWEFVVQLTPDAATSQYKTVDSLPVGTPIKTYAHCLKTKIKAGRVYKKVIAWYGQGAKEDKYSRYRFTGKDSKLFSKNCMYLLSSLIDTRPNLNLTHLGRMKLFLFHYLGLLLRAISSLMARIHVRSTYVNELNVKCIKSISTVMPSFFKQSHPLSGI